MWLAAWRCTHGGWPASRKRSTLQTARWAKSKFSTEVRPLLNMNHFCTTIKLEVRSGTIVSRRLSLKPADRCAVAQGIERQNSGSGGMARPRREGKGGGDPEAWHPCQLTWGQVPAQSQRVSLFTMYKWVPWACPLGPPSKP